MNVIWFQNMKCNNSNPWISKNNIIFPANVLVLFIMKEILCSVETRNHFSFGKLFPFIRNLKTDSRDSSGSPCHSWKLIFKTTQTNNTVRIINHKWWLGTVATMAKVKKPTVPIATNLFMIDILQAKFLVLK